ncbi:MAG: hypothetical protein JWM89_895 [Acidimicrobiales bacterium]|nr:hypothetical protein [Acidimicrobiales bacterium]
MASTTRTGLDLEEAGSPRSGSTGSVAGRAFLGVGLLLIAFSAVSFVLGGGSHAFAQKPLDLNINLVAANRLVHHEPLYDRSSSRVQAIALGGPSMNGSYTVPTNSFPGPPSTALLHAPFLLFDHGTGVAVFRWLAMVGMAAAVALTANSLPKGSRLPAGVFGLGVLLAGGATLGTLQFGQGHEFVMLGFAAGIWGVSNERWKIAGVGFGLATVLKLSPALLLVYLLIRGRREVLASAAATIGVLTAVAAAIGRPDDLLIWFRDVVPGVSGGAFTIINQSLPGLAARAFSGRTDLQATAELGAWHYLAFPIVAGAAFGLWRLRRGKSVDPMEIGILLMVGLIAGPLSWNHYATWAVLPLVLAADPRRWVGRSTTEARALILGLALAVILLIPTVGTPSATAVRAHWMTRITSSPYVVAEVLILFVLAGLLRTGRRSVA